MLKTNYLAVLSSILFLGVVSCAQAELPPLIPREVLMGNPVQAYAQISPDAQWYSYVAPSPQGVMNVWIQDINKTKPARMITNDTHRGISVYGWTKDGKQILYAQDKNGDENTHLYAVDLQSNKETDLTPYPGVKATAMDLDKKFPQQILIGLNLRNKQVFDMYRIDLTNGKTVLDTKNPGDVSSWLADNNFQIRAAVADNAQDGSSSLLVRDNVNAPWRKIMTWPFGENGGPMVFSNDGKSLIITSTLNSNTEQLQEIDTQTGKIIRVLAQSPNSDVSDAVGNPDTHKIEAVLFDYLKPEWKVLDPSVKADFAALKAANKGDFYISTRDAKDQHWVVTFNSDNVPASYYLYDRATKKLQLLFVARPALQKYTLAKMQPEIITASDGMKLVAYLTLPVGVTPKNLPLVLNVHGGPWVRDEWGYNPEAQWLANRGYAVLQVNYRGSTGFGKQYENAGNGQWGTGTMQRDLTDSVNWAIQKGIADPKKACIYGGSYGGYATLAGLTFTPNVYACGVDIVGPTNLKTLLASIPAYWQTGKKEMLLRMGDVEHDSALNEKISPLFHVNNIRVPLLIAQGLHDPRVNVNQAETIVKAMREKNLPVTYVLYSDEGHGFVRPANRLDFYGRAEEFLAKYLGGRAQPWQKVDGSTAKIS